SRSALLSFPTRRSSDLLRTRLAPTLPDEQADPAEIETPARSNAMSAVSALTPGMAKKTVLGRRASPSPKIIAPGTASRMIFSIRSEEHTSELQSRENLV